MLKNLKMFTAGLIIGTLFACAAAYAAVGTRTIDVEYSDIKVYKDNILCTLTDANGSTVEPFIYNGTTYLPVRGVASAAGMDVTWDGTTKSVYLWDELTADGTYLLDVCPPYDTPLYYEEYSPTSGKSFSMAGKKYSNGFTLAAFNDFYALFNLDGKYSSLEFTVGCADYNNSSATGTISFIVDGTLISSIDVDTEMLPQTVSVPLNYGLQMKVLATGGKGSSNITIGLANIIVK